MAADHPGSRSRIWLCAVAVLLLGVVALACTVQGHMRSHMSPAGDYPNRPVTLVVTFPPGGGTDTLARKLASRLESRLGQPVVVENRAGASGNIGAQWVARSKPDGYTLLVVNSSYAVNPGVFNNLGFDPARDLTGVINIAYVPSVLVARPGAPWATLGQALSDMGNGAGRHAPTMASCGNGTPQHLAGEMLMERSGAVWLHVPYRGCGPALAGVMAGSVDLAMVTASSASPLIAAGSVRPLAVTSPRRSPLMPEVPTVAEQGFDGYELDQWHGLLAPAGTPLAVIDKLNLTIAALLREPDMAQSLKSLGYDLAQGTPDDFQAIIDNDIARFGRLTRDIGLRID